MKLKLAPRERKMVFYGAIAAAIIIVVYAVIMPFFDYRATLKREIAAKTDTLRQHLKMVQERELLLAKKSELTQRMEKANAKLLPETVPTAAANQLQQIADGLLKNLEIQNRRPVKEERVKEEYQKVATQVDFQCEIMQLVPVLYEIKNFDKNFISMDTLEVTYQQYAAKAKDSKLKPLRVSMTLSTLIRYIAPEKKEDKDAGRGKTAPAGVKAEGPESVPKDPSHKTTVYWRS